MALKDYSPAGRQYRKEGTITLSKDSFSFGPHRPDPYYEKVSIRYDQENGLIQLVDRTSEPTRKGLFKISIRKPTKGNPNNTVYYSYPTRSFSKSGLMPFGQYERVEGTDEPHLYKFVQPLPYRKAKATKKIIVIDEGDNTNE